MGLREAGLLQSGQLQWPVTELGFHLRFAGVKAQILSVIYFLLKGQCSVLTLKKTPINCKVGCSPGRQLSCDR